MNEVIRNLYKQNRFLVLCLAVILLAGSFLVSVAAGGEAKTKAMRTETSVPMIQDVDVTLLQNENTPCGVRKQYSFSLNTQGMGSNWLMFYVHNEEVTVTISGTLVYSRTAQDDSQAGLALGGTWVLIPLLKNDDGRLCTIMLTPVYQSAVENDIEIYIGDQHELTMAELNRDLPAILAVLTCLTIGFFYLIISLLDVFMYRKRYAPLGWLGFCSILIALWKLFGLRSFPLFMPGSGTLQDMTSLTCLLLAPVAACIYEQRVAKAYPKKLLNILSGISLSIAGLQLVLQCFRILDLQQTLPLTQINICISLFLVISDPILSWRKNRDYLALMVPLVFAAGVALDLFSFYADSFSQNAIYTVFAAAVYMILSGIRYLRNMQKENNHDALTGLSNKRHYQEIENTLNVSVREPGLVMMDLNGLKRTNDTFGHQIGDFYIRSFAGILQNAAIRRTMLFRVGGDEFICLVLDASPVRMDQFLSNLQTETQAWNEANPGYHMSCSIGTALYIDHPGLSLASLEEIADAAMYEDKKAYYQKTGTSRI